MLPGPTEADQTKGFFILLVKRASSFMVDVSDDDYRRFRSNLLYAYALNLLRKNPQLKIVVGIAMNGELRRGGKNSEDLIYAEQPEWTDEFVKYVEEMRVGFDIFRDDISPRSINPLEYPEDDEGLFGEIEDIPYTYVDNPDADDRMILGRKRLRSTLLSTTSLS